MDRGVCYKAPAKINLHLDILESRTDGFHNLISLFQMISLYDIIRIRSLTTRNVFSLYGEFGFPVAENIITKAVRLFRAETGIRHGIEIRVEKQIPMGAGLGGGSSDAAAVINGLDTLFETRLSPLRRGALAAELGSDVPFFISSVCAIVSGRGEIIKPLTARGDFYLLLIYPGFKVKTARAFQWLDSSRVQQAKRSPVLGPEQLAEIYRSLPISAWPLENSFRQVLNARYPEYTGIQMRLQNSGACYINISGSGSAIFGIFMEKKRIKEAFNFFKTKYSFVRIVKPLDKRPSFVLE